MNAGQAKPVFMKIQIIQARLPEFGLLLLNTYAETELAATGSCPNSLNMPDNFYSVFASFGNSELS